MMNNIPSVLFPLVAVLGCSLFTDQVNTASTPPLPPATSNTTENPSAPIVQPVQVQTIASTFRGVDTFTSDELVAANSGGCGMSLQAKSAKGTQDYLFFNGISPDSMLMKINGKMTRFSIVAAEGNDFYGQKNFQTFISEDKKIEVRVAVTQGKVGEIESIDINTGVILVKTEDSFQELAVIGGAGC